MIFNSVTFFVFLAAFLPAYWLAKPSWRNPLVLAGSYLFYGWWDWRFLSLLALSTLVDHNIARAIHRSDADQRRRRLLIVSATVNLGILGIFKYAGFFAESLQESLARVGVEADWPTLNIILPVGISFYTFQTISYSFDVYRRRVEPQRLVDFATYVAYFPQLVAGPIERAQHLMPQIAGRDRMFPSGPQLGEAVRLILGGLFKKVVLADGVAPVVNDAFENSGEVSALTAAAAIVGFAIQIYGDFAGYTDIARGVSMLLGIRLVLNFTEPYLSRNITEFWRRWHISLSNWLRDYLYISLGGNRRGTLMTYRNLMLTMLLGGLWHGSSWAFVFWGALHGLYLVAHRLLGSGAPPDHEVRWSDLPRIGATFVAVCVAWAFFRADTFSSAFDLLAGIVTLRGGTVDRSGLLLVLATGVLTVVIDIWQRRLRARTGTPGFEPAPIQAGILVGGAVALILVFSGGATEPFIYFQF